MESRLSKRRNVDSKSAITVLVMLGVIGALGTFSFLPFIVGQAISNLHLSSLKAGLLATAEMGGSGLGTFVTSIYVYKWERKNISIFGLFLIIIGSVLSLGFLTIYKSVSVLLIDRIIVGLGEGSIMGAVSASISGSSNPERVFGIWTIFNMVIASLLYFFIIPKIIFNFGIYGLFVAYVCLALPGFISLVYYPKQTFENKTASLSNFKIPYKVIIILFGILIAHLAHGGVWAYMTRLGNSFSLSNELVSKALGTASLIGIIAGVLATWISNRFGRVIPNSFALVGSITSMILIIVITHSMIAYFTIVVIFYFSWTYGLPYLMGIVSALDPTGRSASLGILVQNVGLAIGPIILGTLLYSKSFFIVGWYGLVLYAICLPLVIPLAKYTDKN